MEEMTKKKSSEFLVDEMGIFLGKWLKNLRPYLVRPVLGSTSGNAFPPTISVKKGRRKFLGNEKFILIHGPPSIVSDENNLVQVGSFFKGDNFVRFMGDTFARGGIVPHVQIDPVGSIWISYIEKGTTLHGGIGYFVTDAYAGSKYNVEGVITTH